MMVTTGDPKGTSAVKVWSITREATSLVHTLHFNEQVVKMALLAGRLVLGHRFGTVRAAALPAVSPLSSHGLRSTVP